MAKGKVVKKWALASFYLFGLIFLAVAARAFQDPGRLIGAQDAVIVASAGGKVLYAQNADKALIPASTLKVLTALVGLHYLGPDHRFKTTITIDDSRNLRVKGYGDPLLTSESLAAMAAELAKRLDWVNDIILDDSYFDHPMVIPGVSRSLNPYDATNGALCANFNTVHFKRDAKGRLVSAEPQTPLLPVALAKARKSGLSKGRIVFSQDRRENTLYAGHLLGYFLEKEKIGVRGKITTVKRDPENDRLVLTWQSPHTMEQVIARLLTYSNNFIANQVLLAAGAAASGPPATLEKGVRAARRYARSELGLKGLQLAEGSGISRKNRISANQLLRVLEAFLPYHGLMKNEDGQFYKTGSLSGIRTRVGYLEGPDGALYRFVVLINTPGKSTDSLLKWIKASTFHP